jgi:hypothetical protein
MPRWITTAACAVILTTSMLNGAAVAQSYEAPAGGAPVTAPGGTEAPNRLRNEQEAIRSGETVIVSPGVGAIEKADPSTSPAAGERDGAKSPPR